MSRTLKGVAAKDAALSGIDLAQTVASFTNEAIQATRAPASGESPAPPQIVFPGGDARYQRGTTLGQGGMGTVMEAIDRQFGRRVAVKELTSRAPDAETVRRFMQEAVVTANLEHSGIPAVYERGIADGTPFYAMRKIDGRTLAEAIKDATSVEQRLALVQPVIQVAHTLGFAHEHGVVHRDVKPDNVLLGDHGESVLLDWGIARVRGLPDAPGAGLALGEGARGTAHGSVLGTPSYMAPEQALGDVDRIDERTDVFALGAILYHALSGRPPYEHPTALASLAHAAEARHPPLSRLAPNAPAALVEIVDKAMSREPSDRYANANEVADALQSFVSGALTTRPSPFVRLYAAFTSIGAVGFVVTLSFMTWQHMSTIAEQGYPALFYLTSAGVGLTLCAIEWRTAGRYHLDPLIFMCLGLTLLVGIVGMSLGLGVVMQYASNVAASGDDVSGTLIQGTWELSGILATSGLLSCLQLVAWALSRRSVLSKSAAERG